MAGFKQGGVEFKRKSVIGNPTTGDHIIVYWNDLDNLVIKTSGGEDVIATETLMAAISGSLQTKIDNIALDYPALSGALEDKFVAVEGDTMTGPIFWENIGDALRVTMNNNYQTVFRTANGSAAWGVGDLGSSLEATVIKWQATGDEEPILHLGPDKPSGWNSIPNNDGNWNSMVCVGLDNNISTFKNDNTYSSFRIKKYTNYGGQRGPLMIVDDGTTDYFQVNADGNTIVYQDFNVGNSTATAYKVAVETTTPNIAELVRDTGDSLGGGFAFNSPNGEPQMQLLDGTRSNLWSVGVNVSGGSGEFVIGQNGIDIDNDNPEFVLGSDGRLHITKDDNGAEGLHVGRENGPYVSLLGQANNSTSGGIRLYQQSGGSKYTTIWHKDGVFNIGNKSLNFSSSQFKIDNDGDVIISNNLDVEDNLNVGGDTIITGNLTVQGVTSTVNSQEVLVEDNILTLNAGLSGVTAGQAGLEIYRDGQPNAQLLWDDLNELWTAGVSGSMANIETVGPVASYSTTQTITQTKGLAIVDTSGGDVTLTIQDATAVREGELLRIIKIGGGKATIQTVGGQEISGQTTQVINEDSDNKGIAIIDNTTDYVLVQDSRFQFNTIVVSDETEFRDAFTSLRTLGGGTIIVGGLIELTSDFGSTTNPIDHGGIHIVGDRSDTNAIEFRGFRIYATGSIFYDNLRFRNDKNSTSDTNETIMELVYAYNNANTEQIWTANFKDIYFRDCIGGFTNTTDANNNALFRCNIRNSGITIRFMRPSILTSTQNEDYGISISSTNSDQQWMTTQVYNMDIDNTDGSFSRNGFKLIDESNGVANSTFSSDGTAYLHPTSDTSIAQNVKVINLFTNSINLLDEATAVNSSDELMVARNGELFLEKVTVDTILSQAVSGNYVSTLGDTMTGTLNITGGASLNISEGENVRLNIGQGFMGWQSGHDGEFSMGHKDAATEGFRQKSNGETIIDGDSFALIIGGNSSLLVDDATSLTLNQGSAYTLNTSINDPDNIVFDSNRHQHMQENSGSVQPGFGVGRITLLDSGLAGGSARTAFREEITWTDTSDVDFFGHSAQLKLQIAENGSMVDALTMNTSGATIHNTGTTTISGSVDVKDSLTVENNIQVSTGNIDVLDGGIEIFDGTLKIQSSYSSKDILQLECSENNGHPINLYGRRGGFCWYADVGENGNISHADNVELMTWTVDSGGDIANGDIVLGVGQSTGGVARKPRAYLWGGNSTVAFYSVHAQVNKQILADQTTMRVAGDTANGQTGNIFEVGDQTETFFKIGANGNVDVYKDLIVHGTTTTLNTQELLIEDNILTINSSISGYSTEFSGIEINRDDNPYAQVLWDEVNNAWTVGVSGNTTNFWTLSGGSEFVNKSGDTMSGQLVINHGGPNATEAGIIVNVQENSGQAMTVNNQLGNRVIALNTLAAADQAGFFAIYSGSIPTSAQTDTTGMIFAVRDSEIFMEHDLRQLNPSVFNNTVDINNVLTVQGSSSTSNGIQVGSYTGGNDPLGSLPASPSTIKIKVGGVSTSSGAVRAGMFAYESHGDVSYNPRVIYGGIFIGRNNSAGGTGLKDAIGTWGEAYGNSLGVAYGVYGRARNGATNWAGYFDGDVNITDDIYVSDAFIAGQTTFSDLTNATAINSASVVMSGGLAVQQDVIFDQDLSVTNQVTVGGGGANGGLSIERVDVGGTLFDAYISGGGGYRFYASSYSNNIGRWSVSAQGTQADLYAFNSSSGEVYSAGGGLRIVGNTNNVGLESNSDGTEMTLYGSNVVISNDLTVGNGEVEIGNNGGHGSNHDSGFIRFNANEANTTRRWIIGNNGTNLHLGTDQRPTLVEFRDEDRGIEIQSGTPLIVNDNLTVGGNTVITGDLTVQGTTTTVNTEEIHLADNIITLNSDFVSGSPTQDAGIEVSRGDEFSARLIWDETQDFWTAGVSGSEVRLLTENDALFGTYSLSNGEQFIEVTFGTTLTTTPVINATLELPISGSDIHLVGVHDITTTGFKATLSNTIVGTGYKVNWVANGTGGFDASNIDKARIRINNIHSYSPPSSNFATIDTRNNHRVLDFDDSTDETAVFDLVMPDDYSGGSVRVNLFFAMSSATADDVVLATAFERIGDEFQNLDSDSFGTEQTQTVTVPSTSGLVKTTETTHLNSEIDGLQSGEVFRLRVKRLGTDVADTALGDLELLRVEIIEL